MNTAVKLNQLVKDRSTGTQLLVINLPGAPSDENEWLHCILFIPPVYFKNEKKTGVSLVFQLFMGWKQETKWLLTFCFAPSNDLSISLHASRFPFTRFFERLSCGYCAQNICHGSKIFQEIRNIFTY